MSKFKTIAKLAKINHELGLLDAGDMVNIASAAYKVKRFDPKDHLPDWELFEDEEEYERAQRRKTLLIAGAVAGGTYLLYKNRDKVADAAVDARSKTRELTSSGDKGEEFIDDVADKSKEAYRDIKAKSEDAKEKGEEVKRKAVDKGADLADDVADKAKDAKKDIKKLK
ncbi:hypothetical protein [uncultured Anaerococcus sp.]|mgnify:FL=1|uniref:hypothetical protein n=1 Tax=uncultured Anaerococcus sp. TaxID=293428 RepID=UPI002608813F|nr:hypothetical protein [uncultured Anaerococcus sp.]